MDNILQIIASFMGAAGFALVFNVHGRKIIWIGFGGAFSWIVYLVTQNLTGSEFVSLMVATMAVVASSEILARVIKEMCIRDRTCASQIYLIKRGPRKIADFVGITARWFSPFGTLFPLGAGIQ